MKKIDGYKRELTRVRLMMSRQKNKEALSAVDSLLEGWPDQPALHVLRAELIQLQDESGPGLDEALAALRCATALDDRNAEAWLELGHFQFAVEDDAKSADKAFVQAIEASRASLIAALVGRAAVQEELGHKQAAFDCLSAARQLQNAGASEKGSFTAATDVLGRWESLVGTS